MYHIDQSNVDEYWPEMCKGLERALSKTHLGLTWDLESALSYIKRGRLFGFYDETSGYSGLYSINETPLARILYWFWSGKDPMFPNLPDANAVGEYLDNASRIFECKYITAEGRPGFKHLAKSLGFQPDSNTWLKEVTL